MERNLRLVIKYLNGELDIYKDGYENVVNTWNQVWDEIVFMGCDPNSVEGIEEYMDKQL